MLGDPVGSTVAVGEQPTATDVAADSASAVNPTRRNPDISKMRVRGRNGHL